MATLSAEGEAAPAQAPGSRGYLVSAAWAATGSLLASGILLIAEARFPTPEGLVPLWVPLAPLLGGLPALLVWRGLIRSRINGAARTAGLTWILTLYFIVEAWIAATILAPWWLLATVPATAGLAMIARIDARHVINRMIPDKPRRRIGWFVVLAVITLGGVGAATAAIFISIHVASQPIAAPYFWDDNAVCRSPIYGSCAAQAADIARVPVAWIPGLPDERDGRLLAFPEGSPADGTGGAEEHLISGHYYSESIVLWSRPAFNTGDAYGSKRLTVGGHPITISKGYQSGWGWSSIVTWERENIRYELWWSLPLTQSEPTPEQIVSIYEQVRYAEPPTTP